MEVSNDRIVRIERGLGQRGPTIAMLKRVAEACDMHLIVAFAARDTSKAKMQSSLEETVTLASVL